MKVAADNKLLKNITLSLSLVGFLLYFGIFNRYHLAYLEQIQLFRYDPDYLADFFQKPGGLIYLLGSFLTQFFRFPWIGALILTLLGFSFYLLTQHIFRRLGLKGILFSLIPLLLLAALHSNHNYPVALTLGFLFSLACFTAFIQISDTRSRFLAGMFLFVLMYYGSGMFSFLTLALCVLYELLYGKGIQRYSFLIAGIALSLLVPYISWKFIYLIPLKQAWLLPVSFSTIAPVISFFCLLSLYYPLLIMSGFLYQYFSKNTLINFSWNLKHLIPGTVIYMLAGFMIIRLAYDPNNELFLNMDAKYHASSWDKVLTLSEKYAGQNQLVMYLTNLALYKSGNLSNAMFNYNQAGTKGLWLAWERNETAPFFGGEVYYHLGYTNEAFRWAFEAMEVKGLNPRSLKRLITASIINRNYEVAGKFLNYLDQTLLYRNWANVYRRLIADTTLIYQQPELLEKRQLLMNTDFIAVNDASNIGLDKLLENHPDNRMAFEYLMASFLLRKDLDAFAANIYRLKDLGYEKIPLHYEEALVLYTGLSGKNMIPEGFIISTATQKRFHDYAKVFAANRYEMDKAARALYGKFGGTFWFYMQFASVNTESSESNI